MRPIKLIFHPKETCFPAYCFRTRADSVWFPMDATSYVAETYQFVYEENLAIGLCGLFPRSKCLGYHYKDIERITYYYSPTTKKLVRVLISAHSNESHVLTIPEDADPEEPIVVYVAKGSHAFYEDSGIQWRIMGLANDICGNGKIRVFTAADVQELNEPIEVQFGFTVDPTSQSTNGVLSKWERFWLPFYQPK